MIHNEFKIVQGKKVAYIRYNDWREEVILFFHGFTGSKGLFSGS